jgi:hypothetical protein
MDDVSISNHLVEDVTRIDLYDDFTADCETASVIYLVFDLCDKSTYEQLTKTILPML